MDYFVFYTHKIDYCSANRFHRITTPKPYEQKQFLINRSIMISWIYNTWAEKSEA